MDKDMKSREPSPSVNSGDKCALADLIARVEAATEGSRELDGLIECAARWQQGLACGFSPEHIAVWRTASSVPGLVESQGTRYFAEPMSTTLAAALGLAERVLPGWLRWIDEHFDDDSNPYWMVELAGPGRFNVESEAPTPALALVAAILKAKAGETA